MVLNGIYGDSAVAEATLDFQDVALENAIEFERSYGNLMLELCADEFHAYQESGDIAAVNEGARLDKIKNWFKQAWEKIKALFNKVMTRFRAWFSSNSSFYDKYEKQIKLGASKVKEFKGYTFAGAKQCDTVLTKAYNAIVKLGEGTKEATKVNDAYYDGVRGALCDKSTVTKDSFGEKLNAFMHGSDEKKTMTMTSDEINSCLKNQAYINKVVAANLKVIEAQMKRMVGEIEDSLDKDAENKGAAKQLEVYRTCQSLVMQYINAANSSLAAYVKQGRAYAYAAVKAAQKKDSSDDDAQNEAAEYLKEIGIELA